MTLRPSLPRLRHLPAEYPAKPPQINYHSYGYRLHPNLYAEGKVCLSLLGTWSGKSAQKWNPKESNLVQLFISLQGLVVGQAEPYYLEAGNTLVTLL
jgi:ubiquitin-conjugating enzyme E2 O